jgi:thymidylate kinase
MTDPSPPSESRRPLLVSFSGIDGAGKSTQIKNLHSRLQDAGLSVRLLAFWDDIAVLKQVRESSRRALFKGDTGVGSPNQPVDRRDKNIRTWYMNGIRFFLYSLDAAWLNIVVMKAVRNHADVVIFDRYLYDELANLPLQYRVTRSFVSLLVKLVPQPDIACLLDADPVLARERKPEYPLEFVQSNRAAYLALSELSGAMTVINTGTAAEVAQEVMQKVLKKLPADQRSALSLASQRAESSSVASFPGMVKR